MGSTTNETTCLFALRSLSTTRRGEVDRRLERNARSSLGFVHIAAGLAKEHTGDVHLQLQIIAEHINTRHLHIPPVRQQVQDEKMNHPLILEWLGNAVSILSTIVGLHGKQLEKSRRHIIGDRELFGQLFWSAIKEGFVGILVKLHHTIEKNCRLNLGRRRSVLKVDTIQQLLDGLEPKSSAGQIVPPVSLLLRYGIRHAGHITPKVILGNLAGTKDFVGLLSSLIEWRQECTASRGKRSLGRVDL